ncbi:diguanylate cyclase [Halobacillus locisalis]|uniref:Diguanylate cyclase n=1 Tax=Halobacillus locisalis TaxID=220753 RepID=A0A838CV70_9BACI|nr:diguanylate cyclase [Halobacillus locisalis]MBA2175719.1 diguanylate cyclase [Halobacillus locisalis]
MSTITKKLAIFLILTTASYYLNTLTVSLYYGVHFLFGSIPLIILLKKLGVWPAFIGAIIAQSYTIFIWSHPYALFIFSLEILFIGYFFKDKLSNLIIRDALYWLLLGGPLVFVFYGSFLNFGLEGTILVALKDTMNGLVNVWVAEFVYFLFVFIANVWKSKYSSMYTMREVVSYLSSGVLLVLSFTLVMLIGYYEQTKDRSQLSITAEDKLSEVNRFYQNWFTETQEEHNDVLNNLEEAAPNPQNIDTYLEGLTTSSSATSLAVVDTLDSSMYMFDEGGNQLSLQSEIDGIEGALETRHSLSEVEAFILDPLRPQEIMVSLISEDDQVIFSNNPRAESGARYPYNSEAKVLQTMESGQVIAYQTDVPAMQMWKQSIYKMTSESLTDAGAFFVVGAAFTPFIDYQLMNQALAIVLAVVILTLIIGELLTDRLLKRFESLSNTTSEVVEALPDISREIELPRSIIYEFETLSVNFQAIVNEWQQKYMATHEMNEELQEKKKQLEQSQQKMEYMAHYDALTGLPNRRKFNKTLDEIMAIEDNRFGLLFIDLDHFKSINDRYGHEVGDQVLQQVSTKLESADLNGESFRLSGDEFTVILHPLVNEEKMHEESTTILNHIQEPFLIDGQKVHVNLSIGMAIYPDHTTDKEELIRLADHAMYKSKKKGRNQISW